MKKLFAIIVTLLFLPIAYAQQPAQDPGVTPDSFLWGLDKALEQLALLLTFDEGDKAKKGLEIARERLLEIKEMIEENKSEAAEKAKDEHGKTLVKVKESVKELEEEDSLEEINEVIEIEKELEEHDEEVEQTFGELKVKIKIEGEVTEQQTALIESILNSLKGQTGEVEIEIKNKKDKTKIKIEQETGKSEEEIEVEVEDIEKEKGIKKEEKAFEAIEDAEEEFKEFLEDAEEKGIVVSQDLINQFNSLLEQAISQVEQGNFIEARKLAKQAEKLLDEEEEIEEELEEEENEIEVEIEEGKAKVEVEIGGAELEFELDTTDLDTIVNEISARTGLSTEEINDIIEVEDEDEGARENIENAQLKINEAVEALTAAPKGLDLSSVEQKIMDAKEKLAEAEALFTEADFAAVIDKAEDAEQLAADALDALEDILEDIQEDDNEDEGGENIDWEKGNPDNKNSGDSSNSGSDSDDKDEEDDDDNNNGGNSGDSNGGDDNGNGGNGGSGNGGGNGGGDGNGDDD